MKNSEYDHNRGKYFYELQQYHFQAVFERMFTRIITTNIHHLHQQQHDQFLMKIKYSSSIDRDRVGIASSLYLPEGDG